MVEIVGADERDIEQVIAQHLVYVGEVWKSWLENDGTSNGVAVLTLAMDRRRHASRTFKKSYPISA